MSFSEACKNIQFWETLYCNCGCEYSDPDGIYIADLTGSLGDGEFFCINCGEKLYTAAEINETDETINEPI